MMSPYGTLSLMFPLIRSTAVAACLLLALPVHAEGPDIALTLFRAVRIGDSGITLSFVTDTNSIATLVYAGPGDRTVTLTDTIPQTDHLFTLDELSPSAAYSLTITADAGDRTSHTYIVLLSPAAIGQPGESIVPSVQEMDSNGKILSSTLAASTTPVASGQAPLAAAIALVALGFIAVQLYSFMKKRAQKRKTVTF